MNHVYRLKRSGRTQQLQPVPETARAASKGARTGKTLAQTVGGTLASVALSGMASLAYAQQAPPAVNQLPQGGVVTRGSASIHTGTTSAGNALMTVNQASNRAVIDWTSFNVGSQAKVQFNQPSSSAVVLNNILGNNASQIYGQISANGQVFLSNPNGVYFSPTAQVNVGGLVATTGNTNADEFMAGKVSFNRAGSTGSVVNEGQLTSAAGGYIALLAPEVRNQGIVVAQAGTVALASGEVIMLSFNNSGTGLAGITTTPQTIAALVENRSAVLAEGGQIILSAHALAALQGSVVKSSGQLSATSLIEKGGKIVLMADSIELSSTSRIEANGPTGGGTVLVGGDWQGSGDTRQATQVTMAQGASIEANATEQGDGGKVVLWSDVTNASSVTQVDGRIDAKGAGAGHGGQVETSGHTLKVGEHTRVNTTTPHGVAGQWLLDPNDFTVAASGGDITGTALSANLASGNVTIASTSGATASTTNGSIFVNDTLAWSANTLTLNAQNNVTVNKALTLTGTAGLAVQYGQQSVTAAGNNALFTVNAPINIASTGSFATKLGSATGSVSTTYTIVNTLGVAADAVTAPASATLQGMAKNLSTSFVLGSDIDASSTASWNSSAGFTPIGTSVNAFTGKFNGLGHTITGLNINAGTSDYLGLFGKTTGSVANITLSAPSIVGLSYVGTVAGYGADFYNVRILGGSVMGTTYVGGLAGYASLSSDTVSSSALVIGQDSATSAAKYVGGVLGVSVGAINNATGMGNVTVTNTNTALVTGVGTAYIHSVGGLVGQLAPAATMILNNNTSTGHVSVSTATANITSGPGYLITNVGGLIGTLGAGANGATVNMRVTLINSSTSGNISASSTTSASMSSATTRVAYATGGLLGRVDYGGGANLSFGGGVTLTNLSASGTVNGYSGVGGLVGVSSLGGSTAGLNVFSSLVATGNVTGFGSVYGYNIQMGTGASSPSQGMGGLFGVNQGVYVAQINDSHYSGAVLSRGGLHIGGLVGTNTGVISNSYATGTISMPSSSLAVSGYSAGFIGGLVGLLGGGSTPASIVGGSYSNVDITLGTSGASTTVSRVGGLVGSMEPSSGGGTVYISGARAQGAITGYLTISGGYNGTGIGGLVGQAVAGTYFTGTASVSGNTLTVSSIASSYLGVGSVVSGPGLLPGTYISALGSGSGGIGTYQLNQSQTSAAGVTITAYPVTHIDNSAATGNVSADYANNVGGLAGSAWSVSNSHASGNVTGRASVGGLIGSAHSVYSSYALGNVTGATGVGGLVGQLNSNLLLGIYDSYWTGQQVTSSSGSVGGLVGIVYLASIYNSFANGNGAVIGNGSNVGGLVGSSTGDIYNSYSTLTVTGGSSNVGGLVGSFGSLNTMPILSNSSAVGAVTGTNGVGGLVGNSYGTVVNSYASGAVTSTSSTSANLGGLLGMNSGGGSVSNSFANGTVTSNSTSTSAVAYVGGLIGYNQSSGSVNNSYASGTVTVNGLAVAGGLVGYTAIPVVATSQNVSANASQTSSTTLTLSNYSANGVVGVGATISGTGIPSGTTITAMSAATGSLTLSQAVTVSNGASMSVTNTTVSSSASISGNTLTLGGTVTGYFAPGTAISGAGIPAGTYITAVQSTTGTTQANGFGGAGSTYTLNNSATVTGIPVTGTNVAVSTYSKVPLDGFLVASSVAGGLSVGMTVVGPGIPDNTTITGVSTKTVGTTATLGYTLSNNFGLITSPIAVVGQMASPNISNVYATGNVISNAPYSASYSYLSGLIGQVGSTFNTAFSNAYSSGMVTVPTVTAKVNSVSNANGITVTTGSVTGGGVTLGAGVSGTGIPNGTTVTAFGTGTGGEGTYTLSNPVTLTANQVITFTPTGPGKIITGGVIGYIGSGNTSGTALGAALAPTLSNLYFNSSVNSGLLGVGNDVLTPAGNLSSGTLGLSSTGMRTTSLLSGFTFTDSILGAAANGRAAAGNYWVLVDEDGSYNNAGGTAGVTYPMLASEYALKVTSVHQLQLMGLNPAGNYVQQNSIQFGGSDVWSATGFVPVGTSTDPFTGSFTGSTLLNLSQVNCPMASGGCTITGLNINSNWNTPVGLFGTVDSGASVSGVRLLNATVSGAGSVGAVVGSNAGNLVFSSSSGTVSSSAASGSYGAGGIVGENTGTVDRVFSTATVTAAGGGNSLLAGGVMGKNKVGGTLSNAYAASTGSISASGFAGGLAGANTGTISNSYAAGRVVGATAVAGGLVGNNYSGTLSNSFWDLATTQQTAPVSVPAGGGGSMGGMGGPGGSLAGTLNNNAGMSTLDMQTLANYNSATGANAGVDPGWNFSTIWNPPVAGALYPALRDFLIPITVTANAVSKVYDGTAYSGPVSLSYSLPNVTLAGTAAYTSAAASYINVGSYNSLMPTGLYSNQYNVMFASGALTITPKPLTFTASSAPKLYDGTTALDPSNITINGLVGAQTLTITSVNAVSSQVSANASNYINSISLADGSNGGLLANYSVPTTLTRANAPVTIVAKSVTVSGASAVDKTYDGNNTAALTGGSLVGLISGDAVTLTQAGIFASTNAGTGIAVTATNSLSGASAGNYTLTQPTGLSANIAKANATVTANSGTLTYNGTNQTVSGFTATGLVNSETESVLTGVTASHTAKNAGSYVITASGTDANYNLTFVDGALVISKATVTPSLTASDKVYDATTVANGVVGLTGVYSADASAATAVAAGYSFADANVGTGKLVTASGITLGSGLSDNYVLSGTTATATASITPAPLTVTAINAAKFVTQADTAGYAGYAVTGLLGSETAASAGITAGVTLSRSNASVNLADIYPGVLVPTGSAVIGNYAVSYVPGTYTIVPAGQLLVRTTSSSTTYGTAGSNPIASVSYLDATNNTINTLSLSGQTVVNGATVYTYSDGVSGTASFSTALTGTTVSLSGQINVGSYGLVAENFSKTTNNLQSNTATVSGNLTVQPLAITVAATSGTTTYDRTTQTQGHTSGVLTGDAVTVSGVVNQRNAGVYTSALSATGADVDNYSITYSNSNFTINRAVLTTSVSAADKVYDGNTSASLSFTDNRINGDTLTVTATGNFSDKNVGAPKSVTVSGVSLGGADASNYSLNTSPTSTTAAITRLAQVTWVGGTTGSWFDPANWAGGAVPDLSNVANVTIPAGVTVSFDNVAVSPAQAGPVNVDSLGTAGSLALSAGSLNVGLGGVTLNNLTQIGGALATTGALVLGSLSQSAGSLSAGSLSTTTAYSQSGTGTIAVTGDVAIAATAAPVVLGNLSTGGALSVSSTGGSITQTVGTLLTATGPATLSASQGGAAADVTLDNVGNALNGPVTAAGADVRLRTTGELTASVTATGNATLTSGGSTTLGTTSVGSNLQVTTANADVTQTGPVVVGGTTMLNAGTGSVRLTDAGNRFTGSVSVTAASQAMTGAPDAADMNQAPQVVTPRAVQSSLPYRVTLIQLPQGDAWGQVHIEIQNAIGDVQMELPSALRNWIAAAGADVALENGSAAVLDDVHLADNGVTLKVRASVDRSIPLEFVIRAGREQVTVRIVWKP